MNKLHTPQATLARYVAEWLEPISERLEIAYWENTAYVNVRREKVWIQIFLHNINYGGGDVPDARLLEGGDDKSLIATVQHVINLEQERAA